MWSSLGKIHLVDRCLILFMAILLFQSAFNLFSGGAATPQSDNIDLIIRTSTAAIFGYFLSANFIRRQSLVKSKDGENGPEGEDYENASLKSEELGNVENDGDGENAAPDGRTLDDRGAKVDPVYTEARLQVIVATAIGLFCLVMLILIRDISNFAPHLSRSPGAMATIAQFRDFVSGCVGFLIGCPTTQNDDR